MWLPFVVPDVLSLAGDYRGFVVPVRAVTGSHGCSLNQAPQDSKRRTSRTRVIDVLQDSYFQKAPRSRRGELREKSIPLGAHEIGVHVSGHLRANLLAGRGVEVIVNTTVLAARGLVFGELPEA